MLSSLGEAAAVEEAEGVARGVEEVLDVVQRPLLGAEDEDGAALRLLGQPRRVAQRQRRRVERPQDLPVHRQHHRPVPRQVLRRRPDQAPAGLRHPPPPPRLADHPAVSQWNERRALSRLEDGGGRGAAREASSCSASVG